MATYIITLVNLILLIIYSLIIIRFLELKICTFINILITKM